MRHLRVWFSGRLSVRSRLALVAAAVVLVAYVVVAFAVIGMVTDRAGADLAEQLGSASETSEIGSYGRAGVELPAGAEQAPTGSLAVIAMEVRPTLSHWARLWIVITAPVLALVTGLLAWLAAGRALRPVTAIENEFRELAAGDRSRRVPLPGGNDEISRLALTLNETLDTLEAAECRQRRFVADAAHELRGPISVVRTNLEVAAAYPGRVDPQSAIRSVLDDVLHLQAVSDDLLALAKLEAGEVSVQHVVPVDELVAALTKAACVDYHVDIGSRRPYVTGSERQLVRLLQNLVDNAARHAKTSVHVTARLIADTVRIDVDDDGPGIPSDLVEQVFVPFFRADDARSRADGGAGLGLAIVAETARAHGGTVEVLDSPLGGARLRVTLPAHR